MNKKHKNIQVAGPQPDSTWPVYTDTIGLDHENTMWGNGYRYPPKVLVWEDADMYNKSRLYE